MKIVLNGEKTDIPKSLSVSALLLHLHVDPSRVALEINRQLIRKTSWEETMIQPDDEIEIVHFVGGGRF